MKKQLQGHFTDLEMINLEMNPEIDRWLDKMDFINTEINFLRTLLFRNFILKINKDVAESKDLLSLLDELQERNNLQLKRLRDFRNKLVGLRECDDVQCENLYLGEYLIIKEGIYEHFEELQQIKALLYDYFGNG